MNDERPHVSILTGFLGSGKTTLLHRLLQNPEMRDTVVIVNEFGEIGIDHALVETSTDGVVLLASGCLCCTVRGDLLATLSELAAKRRAGSVSAFRRVVIETTGLADPVPILQALMSDYAAVSEYRVGSVVTVIDAVHGARTLDERFEAVKQVSVADRLVISKTDLVPSASVEQLRARLSALNPLAVTIVAVMGDVAPSRLFTGLEFDLSGKSAKVRSWLDAEADHEHHQHEPLDRNRHDDHIRAHCLTWDEPLAWEWIANGLDALALKHGEHLLRVKGLVNVAGQEEPVLIQGVRNLFHPPSTLKRWPDEDRRTRLVFITEDLDRETVERTIERGAKEGAVSVEI
jgi:G3E family GTPase